MPGLGIAAQVDGHELAIGSAQWLRSRGAEPRQLSSAAGSTVHLAIDGAYRGTWILGSALRQETAELIAQLAPNHHLALLSGDNDRERATYERLFGPKAQLNFNQSPAEKLGFVRALQAEGQTVMMVGDGLNDAGALKQSDVGVAVVEKIGAFSPASDIIIAADKVGILHGLLAFSKGSVRIVRLSFLLSTLYNVVGIAIAAQGLLAPIVCAVLMPLSSISVVFFACGATAWQARRAGISGGSTPIS